MLVYAIVTLAIISVTIGAVVNHTNVDAAIGLEIKTGIDRGFIAFEDSVNLYEKQNQQMLWVESCPPGFSSGDPECEWDREIDTNNDGSIDTANWEAQLIPDYMQKPILKRNFTWSMGEGSSAGELFVCASGPNESYSRYALAGLINSYPDERLIISDTCNGSSLTKSQINSYTGSTISATLKL